MSTTEIETGTCVAWSALQVAAIDHQNLPQLPLIEAADARPVLPGFDLWDMWPVQLANGALARIDGSVLWLVLSAPSGDDPGSRHDVARIRLIRRTGDSWKDCGNAMPDGFSPGSREWAGSAVYDPETARLTLYFTAAGRRDEPAPTFEQRLFQTSGTLIVGQNKISIADWTTPVESVASDGQHYVRVDQVDGEPGHIKAFRDPAFFRDPADGQNYLLFTASLQQSSQSFNGAVGIARAEGEHWRLLAPIVHADGVNNELERPHIIVRNGLYYLFWSTQKRVFAPDGPYGPNGLYGMVANSVLGPYRPLNGTGVVAANPEEEPLQCYSWWVLDTLEVASFVDHWGLKGRRFTDHPEMLRGQFGGTPAPLFSIALNGDEAQLVASHPA